MAMVVKGAAETIRGKVVQSREFADGFRIMTLRCASGDVCARGVVHFDGGLDGIFLCLEGHWQQHPRYGRQFGFDQCTVEGSEIWFFLSRMVTGIGDALATALVDTFGDEELERILDHEPRRLLEVKGIKEKKLRLITESWARNAPLRELSRRLSPHGVHGSMIAKIYSWFKERSLEVVQTNPYLLTEIPGIGFRRADNLALKLGLAPCSPFRIDSCIEYCLEQIGNDDGDTLVPAGRLQELLCEELNGDGSEVPVVSGAEVELRLAALALRGDVVARGGMYASAKNYLHERRIHEIVSRRVGLSGFPVATPAALAAVSARIKSELGFGDFSPEQSAAIGCAASGVSTVAVCGYAGTGKSTVARAMLTLLEGLYGADRIVCCALSGIAADRIRKVSGFPAMTIHSLLKWNGSSFEYGAANPLPYRVVLVDECSMINASIFHQLLEAVADDCVLLLLGDTAQLAPIGPGNVFADLVAAEICPTVKLTRIYRQSADSVLVEFANQIRTIRVPSGYRRQGGFRDFQFIAREIDGWFRLRQQLPESELARIREENAEEVLSCMKDKIVAITPYVDDPLTFFQVLSPQRAGLLGTENLNRVCQEIMNPPSPHKQEISVYGHHFRCDDKVVHIKNKRDMPCLAESDWDGSVEAFDGADGMLVYNGTLGLVARVDEASRSVFVRYPPGVIVKYDHLLITDLLEHAFCLTVHKVQGSEFANVLMPVVSQHWRMMSAQWLYTALTRASRKVVCVGHPYVFEHGCKTPGGTRRSTVLSSLTTS